MFGHTSMLTGDPTSFTVTAQEDTLLYRIAEDAIRPVPDRAGGARLRRPLPGRPGRGATAPARGARGRDARSGPAAGRRAGPASRRHRVARRVAAGRRAADGRCRLQLAAGRPRRAPGHRHRLRLPQPGGGGGRPSGHAGLGDHDRAGAHGVCGDDGHGRSAGDARARAPPSPGAGRAPQRDRDRRGHRPRGDRAAHAVSAAPRDPRGRRPRDAGVGQPPHRRDRDRPARRAGGARGDQPGDQRRARRHHAPPAGAGRGRARAAARAVHLVRAGQLRPPRGDALVRLRQRAGVGRRRRRPGDQGGAAAPRRVGRRGAGDGGHPRLLAGRGGLTPAVRPVGGGLGRGDAFVAREPRDRRRR